MYARTVFGVHCIPCHTAVLCFVVEEAVLFVYDAPQGFEVVDGGIVHLFFAYAGEAEQSRNDNDGTKEKYAVCHASGFVEVTLRMAGVVSLSV